MANEYGVTGKNLLNQQYRKAVIELSPILENAVYLLSKGGATPKVGYHSSKSASCNSCSPCNATSLESKVR